jgi:CheY-like chemotaxis protein
VGAARHLLVVDDEPYIGRIVRMQFEQGPYRVSVATDGREAIEFLAGNADVDAVLLDLNMPGMNGIDVMEAARRDARFAHIAFVVLTAAGQVGQVERARELGAAAVVTKPFSPKKLYRQIAAMFGDPPDADLGGEG